MARPFSETLFGLPRPERLRARGDVAGLIRVLSTPRYGARLRREAATALGELGEPTALEALVSALGEAELRADAAAALGHLGDTRAVQPLIDALTASDGDVRQAVADALVSFADPRSVVPLLADGDTHWAIRLQGAAALPPLIDALADPETNDDARRLMTPSARDASGRPYGPSYLGPWAIGPLVAALDRPEAQVRRDAARLLGQLGDRFGDLSAVEPLAAQLDDADSQVRWQAANALVEFHDSRALEPLLRAVRTGDERAEAAILALGWLGDRRAVPELLDALRAGCERIRHAAADALERLDWQPADDHEAALLAVATEDWDRAESLGSPSVDPLAAMVGTADYSVQHQAATLLDRLGWTPPDARGRLQLAIASGDWDSVAAAGPAAVEPLAAVVAERPDWFRRGDSGAEPATTPPWQAADLLAKSGDPRAIAAVIRQLDTGFERLAAASSRLEGLLERLHDRYDPADFGVADAEETEREATSVITRLLDDLDAFGSDGRKAFAPLLQDGAGHVPEVARSWYEAGRSD